MSVYERSFRWNAQPALIMMSHKVVVIFGLLALACAAADPEAKADSGAGDAASGVASGARLLLSKQVMNLL